MRTHNVRPGNPFSDEQNNNNNSSVPLVSALANEEFHLNNLRPDTCIQVWLFSKNARWAELTDIALNMVVDNFHYLWKTEAFVNLAKKDVVDILRSVQGRSNNMELTRDAATLWVCNQQVPSLETDREIETLVETCRLSMDPPSYWELYPQSTNENYQRYVINNANEQQPYQVDPSMYSQSIYLATVSEDKKPQVVMVEMDGDGVADLTELSQRKCEIQSEIASCFSHGQMYFSGGDKNYRAFCSYDVGSMTWINRSEMKMQREMHTIVAVGQRIYVVGGVDQLTLKAVSRIEKYNPQKNNWSKAGDIYEAKWWIAAAVYQNKILMFGGRSMNKDESKTVQCFDTVSRETILLPDLPVAVANARAVVSGNNAFIISVHGHVIQYSLTDFKSTLLTPMTRRCFNFGVYFRANRIHVVRAEGRNSVSIYTLDVDSNCWRRDGILAHKIRMVCACAAG